MNNEVEPETAVRYEILTEIENVRLIVSEWDYLLATSRCNLAFNCSKWYLARIELLPTIQPLVFTAYRDQVLAGVLPLWLEPGPRLATFGDDYRDYFDIIAADEDREVITGLLKLALQGAWNYDRLDLGLVKRDSNLVKGAEALGLAETVDVFFAPGRSIAYAVLDLSCGYNEYRKRLSRNFRRSLNLAHNRARRDGLIVRELTPADLDPELLPDTFLSLHLSRFGDRSDFRSSESWVRKLFPSLFAEQRMRVFAILNKGQIVGIDLQMITKSGMYSYNTGFLPEMRQYAPGKLMIHQAIEQSCLEGMTEFDLGYWEPGYKLDWQPIKREVGDLQFATGLNSINHLDLAVL